ncbi:hypothetical protein HR060_02285 [Catenovulum sp. SM1970]|uniref:hypothetical protein n=1 Tax=Marinifaba aquimaris TaxID=2741323 RepID=UPI001572DBF6|nr:hypothetical protein [Marinifaba aquimaris]NTS75684.1 hypothetical protein [Marinifaba aquimaris]
MLTKPLVNTLLYLVVIFSSSQAHAALLGYADAVVEYHYTGNLNCSAGFGQGGLYPRTPQFEQCLPFSAVLGDDLGYPNTQADYLSLPLGSFITLSFNDEFIIDAQGDDIFVEEVGNALELADIFVSSNISTNPADFVYLGQADGDQISSFDLSSINFTQQVKAIKVFSLNNGGAPVATGFDIANVRALNYQADPTFNVTEPGYIATLVLILLFVMSNKRQFEF